MASGHELQLHDPAQVGASLGESDDESGARRVQRAGNVPRKEEVVRTPRFHAVDAEFGQADTEELSEVLTAYPCPVIRTWPGPSEQEPAVGARRG